MKPTCWMSARVWRRLEAELERTSPREAVAVPLVALTPRDPDANPCAPVELSGLAEVGIAAIVLVPPAWQVNGVVRVRARPEADAWVDRRLERLVTRFPRLRACAHLHSHPFARGRTRPSEGPGCDVEGHMLPQLERNHAAGLNASFSFIACRDRAGAGWMLQAFALEGSRRIVDLGRVQVLPDDAPRVRAALVPSLWRRDEGRHALELWRAALAERGPCTVDDLFDGWCRTVATVDDATALVLLVPVDYPARPPLLYQVDRRTGASRRLAHEEVERVGP